MWRGVALAERRTRMARQEGGGDEMVILASACGITQVLKAQGTDRRRVARGT